MATTKKQSEPVKARILVDCVLGKCNAIVMVQPDELPALVGVVDADPAAVAYAESL